MLKNSPRKYKVVTILFFFWLLLYFQRINVSVLIVDPGFLTEMGLINNSAGQGLLMTLFLISYSFANIISAPLSDKYGPIRIIFVASIIAAGATLIGGFATSLVTIFWIRIIVGIGQGMYFPAQSKLISNWFMLQERGRANSIWAVAGCVGPIVALPLFTGIISVSSWQYVFIVSGIIGFLILWPIVNGRLMNSPPQQALSLNDNKYVGWHEIKSLFCNINIWLIIISYISILSLWWGLVTWMPQYLVVARNFNLSSMGFASTLPYVFAGIAMLWGGYIGDKMKNQAWLGVFGLLAAALCIIFAIIIQSNAACALLLALALGFNQLYFAPIWSVLQTMLPSNLISTGSGIMNGVGNFFSGLAPVIIGFLIQVSKIYNSGLIYLVVIGIMGSLANVLLATRIQRNPLSPR